MPSTTRKSVYRAVANAESALTIPSKAVPKPETVSTRSIFNRFSDRPIVPLNRPTATAKHIATKFASGSAREPTLSTPSVKKGAHVPFFTAREYPQTTSSSTAARHNDHVKYGRIQKPQKSSSTKRRKIRVDHPLAVEFSEASDTYIDTLHDSTASAIDAAYAQLLDSLPVLQTSQQADSAKDHNELSAASMLATLDALPETHLGPRLEAETICITATDAARGTTQKETRSLDAQMKSFAAALDTDEAQLNALQAEWMKVCEELRSAVAEALADEDDRGTAGDFQKVVVELRQEIDGLGVQELAKLKKSEAKETDKWRKMQAQFVALLQKGLVEGEEEDEDDDEGLKDED